MIRLLTVMTNARSQHIRTRTRMPSHPAFCVAALEFFIRPIHGGPKSKPQTVL